MVFFASFVTPLTLLGTVAVLAMRFGWPGLIIFAVILGILPLQNWVGKMNGEIIQRININKDKRIKICAEIIEGIKFIKLYGWETAFEHIIQTFRKEEIKDYFKLAFTRSLERTFGIVAVGAATYTCFIVMDLTGKGTGLSTAKIFSTIELMTVLKQAIFHLGISFGLYYELQIIYGRFCTIMNIEDKRMVKIN